MGPGRNSSIASPQCVALICRDEVGYAIDLIHYNRFFMLLLESTAIDGIHLLN